MEGNICSAKKAEPKAKPKEAEKLSNRRSFPKPELPAAVVLSSESGPEAPDVSNPRVGLRKQIENEKIEKAEKIEAMDTSQLDTNQPETTG